MKTKKGFAKVLGWIGSILGTIGASAVATGKTNAWTSAAAALGPLLTSSAIHLASETSATNPTGAK